MRTGVTVQLNPIDRKCLQAIIDGRNSPQKHVWRAMIVVGTADGLGTAAIMRAAGVSKTAVWRWQERFMSEGVDGLLRDKTRPARLPKIADATTQRVVTMTLSSPPGESTHWTGRMMAKVAGIPTLADANLDCAVHNAYRLELSGESIRKQSSPAKSTSVNWNQT